MKLTDITNKDAASQIIQQYQRGEKSNQPAVDSKSGAPVAAETVNISSLAKDIQKARNIIAASPDIRDDKVNALKTQLAQGTYKINTDKIAEKMINESLIDIFA